MTSPSTVLQSLSQRLFSGLQFTFHIAGVPAETFSVVRFDYRSRYNELYEVDLLLSAPNTADIDLDVLLDNPAEFKVWQDGVLQGNINGIVAFAEQGDSGFRQTFYRVKVTAQLHRLTLRRNSRIFQLKSVQDILQTLLKEHHIAAYRYLLDNERVHRRREFCVQYRETDFEFLQRLLGEEGIFFYFEQHDSGAETVVFCDKWQKLATDNALTLPYNPNRLAPAFEKKVFTFKFARQLRPDYVQQKDYSFKKPYWQAEYRAEKQGQTESEAFHGLYSHYDYPGRYKDGRGQYYTQTRLDSLRRDANIGVGESNDIGIAVGRLLGLSGHPTARFNTLWQPIAVHHQGEQGQALKEEALASPESEGTTLYSQFEFIPRSQNYRSNFPQKPQISGPQTATVTGPAGEEIFTDDQGRVKVQFHWDRYGKGDDHSSCWIRVASPWAGQGWGMLALPRIGQEVIVSFQ
ncbi:type VI secretion system tip protein VgrG, partial [Aggregatibacter actinomycetemcomitans]|uniref:type VI secretion system tip protein TssI/VgrG n=1 Tax=Aggregatibacter actinomycetemcomitans TaxID=714 RepID=UPI00197B6F7C